MQQNYALGRITDLTNNHHGLVVGPELPEDHLAYHNRLFLQYWGAPPWAEGANFDPGYQKEFSNSGRNAYFVLDGPLNIRVPEQLLSLNGGEYVAVTNKVISAVRAHPGAYGFRICWPEPTAHNLPRLLHHDRTADLESRFNQWLVGHFLADHPLATNLGELKRWHYEGQIDYLPKTFTGEREFITVEGGELEFTFPNGEIPTLRVKAGEYFVLQGGVTKIVKVISYPVHGLCLRWPSFPNINQVGAVASARV